MDKPSFLFYRKTKSEYVYNINHISNVNLILKFGLLSFCESKKVLHKSIANNYIQSNRESIKTPCGKNIHSYANCYFNPRNAMLYKLKNDLDIIVLCINNLVLDLKGVYLTDRNASSKFASFYTPTEGINKINFNNVFLNSWNNIDSKMKKETKSIMQSEVLVPGKISPKYIIEIKVRNEEARNKLKQINCKSIKINIDEKLFFNKGNQDDKNLYWQFI